MEPDQPPVATDGEVDPFATIVVQALEAKVSKGHALSPFDLLRLLTTFVYSGDVSRLKLVLVIDDGDHPIITSSGLNYTELFHTLHSAAAQLTPYEP